jgi:large conductance mechanosensitive channel
VKKLMNEFKDFINKGNLVAIAAAFVLAAAFGAVVVSFVDGIFMNVIAKIVGKDDFAGDIVIADTILVGAFINAVINFVVIAFAVFLIVKAYNNWKKADEAAGPSEEVVLLTEIRDALKARQ